MLGDIVVGPMTGFVDGEKEAALVGLELDSLEGSFDDSVLGETLGYKVGSAETIADGRTDGAVECR